VRNVAAWLLVAAAAVGVISLLLKARRRCRAARPARVLRAEHADRDPGAAPPPGRDQPDRGRGGTGMRHVIAFLRFWYDFIVGDDWRVAVGVAAGLALTALVADRGDSAWWVLPIVVMVVMAGALLRSVREREA
jgi:hypothetical protein